MAGLFSLGDGGGGGGNNNNQDDHPNNPPSGVPHPKAAYFWYKNSNEVEVSCYSRGFELWNQQQLMPPQAARPLLPQDLYSLGVGPSSRSSDDQSSSRSGAIMMRSTGGGAATLTVPILVAPAPLSHRISGVGANGGGGLGYSGAGGGGWLPCWWWLGEVRGVGEGGVGKKERREYFFII